MNRVGLLALFVAACNSGGTADLGAGVAPSGSGSERASGGFSDDIARSLGSGSGSAKAMGSASGSATGSAMAKEPAGSGSAMMVKDPVKEPAGSGSAMAVKEPAGSAKPPAGSGSSVPVVVAPPPKVVQVPEELKKIKLQLGPNWVRDVEGPGTISFVLNHDGKQVTFVFDYGYEDASAPAEREAYKKWLADKKILISTMDRQRGATWYIEGADGATKPLFRYSAQFGDKKLICGGSLYKDAASNALGDLRDDIVLHAKQICETVAL